ncbi:MAG: Wzz/FepE/Etk N-terminal domain-containing protein, partial [Alphaproteobacteria bacterium]
MLSPPDPSRAYEFKGDPAALYANSEESISLREMLTIAFREKRKAYVAFFVPIALAIVAYFIIQPSYTAETTLMVRTGPEYLPSTEGAGNAPSTTKQEQINSEIEILQSRYVAEEAIRRVGLERIYPTIAKSHGGSQLDNAVKRFRGDLGVDVVKLTNVISISFKHKNAAVAKSVLDAVIAAFDERHAAAFSNNQTQAYQQDIDQDVAELQTLSKQREEIKKRTSAFDVEKQRADYLARLKDVQTHLQELNDRKEALNARLAYLHGARSADPTMATSFSNNDEMGYVQNSLSDLKRTEATLLSQYAPDHPRVQAVRAEIAGLESRISALGNQEAKLDAVELAQYPGQAASYREQIDQLTARLKELETADAELHALDA